MKGFVKNIEEIGVNNEYLRQVLYTSDNCQLVIMALKPGEEVELARERLIFEVCQPQRGRKVADGYMRGIPS